ncbi:MAG: hypothetical protein DMD43_05860 [Gemmatimonadetes bacterium]|nr:MAG: hypothetical protein DMD43_05860 [Gemmatimonadota bacterium]
MEASIAGFLDSLGSKLLWLSVTCFVLVNGAAVAAVLVTRSRRLVDKWTSRLMVTDAILVGTAIGGPLLTGAAKLGVHALAVMAGGLVSLFK